MRWLNAYIDRTRAIREFTTQAHDLSINVISLITKAPKMYDTTDRQLLQHIHELLHSQTRSDPALVDLARRVGALEARVMSLKEDFDTAMELIDAKSTDLGKRIDSIVAKLQNPSMTPAEKVESLGHLSAIADSLGAMAQDPANPVPDPTPLPPA